MIWEEGWVWALLYSDLRKCGLALGAIIVPLCFCVQNADLYQRNEERKWINVELKTPIRMFEMTWCTKGQRGIPKADKGEVSDLAPCFKLLKEQQTELRQKKCSLTYLTSVETFGSSPRSPPFGAVMSTVISLICILPTPATCERHRWAFSSKQQTCLWLALTQGLITAGEWDVDLYRGAWVLFSVSHRWVQRNDAHTPP